MCRVTLYKSSDGQHHEKKSDYLKHEALLRMKAPLTELTTAIAKTAEHGGSTAFNRDDRENLCLYVHDVPTFVMQNADALRTILNSSVVKQRTYKKDK